MNAAVSAPLAVLLLLAGCTEYLLRRAERGDSARSGADSTPTGGADEEGCDQEDNDGDGQIDEGFDLDADGVADCLQCGLVASPGAAVSQESGCGLSLIPAAAPWDIEVAWTFDPRPLLATAGGCRVTAVGDLDQDGTPEVVCAATGAIFVLDGRAGLVELILTDIKGVPAPVALADVDGVPGPELIAVDSSGALAAWDALGNKVLQGQDHLLRHKYNSGTDGTLTNLEVFDLDADGRAEVVHHNAIVSTVDGSTSAWLHKDGFQAYPDRVRDALVIDLEGAAPPEILAGWSAWDVLGSLLWSGETTGASEIFERYSLSWGVIGQPGAPDLVLSRYYGVVQIGGTGEFRGVLDQESVPGFGAPCAADLDEDGLLDAIVPYLDRITAFSGDGRVLWSQAASDSTQGVSACTVMDLDLDGVPEVLTLDSHFRILDGRTGRLRYSDPFPNITLGEQPLAVDLDGDGSVELIVPNLAGGGPASTDDPTLVQSDALRVYRHAHGDWPPGAPFWPHANWSGACVWPDGSVDRTCAPGWERHAVFRGQPTQLVQGSDLIPEVVDSCVAEHPAGEARLSVRLVNLGPQEVPEGEALWVYTQDSVLLEVFPLTSWLDDGQASSTWELLTTAEVARAGLVLVAGEPDHLDDCDLNNNTLLWSAPDG